MSERLIGLVRRLIARYGPLHGLDAKSRFTRIYHGDRFGGRESKSGSGSNLLETERIREELPLLVKRLDVRTFLDAPCGDWYWMRSVDLGVDHYVGVDIVEDLIKTNTAQFGGPGVEFQCLDLTVDALPKVDLIFTRDCLVHLSYGDAIRALVNFQRSGATYLLATTFPGTKKNVELAGFARFWRPLNLELPPFNLPPPILYLNENCREVGGRFADKSLGLWDLQRIRGLS